MFSILCSYGAGLAKQTFIVLFFVGFTRYLNHGSAGLRILRITPIVREVKTKLKQAVEVAESTRHVFDVLLKTPFLWISRFVRDNHSCQDTSMICRHNIARFTNLDDDIDSEYHFSQKRTKHDFFGDLTVLVGPEETRYFVHKNLVCKHSDFFEAACKRGWKEASEKIVRLPEVDSDTFGVYIGWLYTGIFDFSSQTSNPTQPAYEEGMDDANVRYLANRIVDCSALGDLLQDLTFRNAVVDEFIRFVEAIDQVPGAGYICPKLRPNSKLAKVYVDYLSADYEVELFVEEAHSYPPDLVLQIAKACVKEQHLSNEDRKPQNRPQCFYHEHKRDSDNCGTKGEKAAKRKRRRHA